ncbi:MAG: UbiA family prenyltransferase [Elusimicrobia bacterium]|nr:UbiA family prenyltransferase [Elusimicrobiota bacterium]
MRSLPALVKVRVSALAGLSALSGLLAGSGDWTLILPLGVGVFLLACGACGLNECLEAGTDKRMSRTKDRPLPSGAMSPGLAALVSTALLVLGSGLLYLSGGLLVGALGLGAAAWYDLVYTPLKRVTAFAAAPGALVGAVPPALGWLAAGRSLDDPRLLAVAAFFYLWQVPHFWLLAPEQEPDLKCAGLPAACSCLGRSGIGRLSAVWMTAASAAALAFPAFGCLRSVPACLVLACASAWLTWEAVRLMSGPLDAPALRRAFLRVNGHSLLVMLLLSADPFLRSSGL